MMHFSVCSRQPPSHFSQVEMRQTAISFHSGMDHFPQLEVFSLPRRPRAEGMREGALDDTGSFDAAPRAERTLGACAYV
jgi:hypothetical protein